MIEVSEGRGYFVPHGKRNEVVDEDLSRGKYGGSDKMHQRYVEVALVDENHRSFVTESVSSGRQ